MSTITVQKEETKREDVEIPVPSFWKDKLDVVYSVSAEKKVVTVYRNLISVDDANRSNFARDFSQMERIDKEDFLKAYAETQHLFDSLTSNL